MQTYSIDIIGTHLRIEVGINTPCDTLFQIIATRLRTFEEKYSRFIPGNWLDTLNQNRIGDLDEDGKIMMEYTLHVARASGGYFDPTIGGTLASLGYGRTEQIGHPPSYQDIHIEDYHITLSGDIILEFGGVGKGYLIDIIKGIIDQHFPGESPRYIIDFGGDIYARGGYKIGLESPFNIEEAIGIITLDDNFLACSSGSKRKWGNHHHLINPKTGESAREVIATFIEGKSGIITDSFATALCVMPFLEACELLFKNPDIEGVIMAQDGRYFQSPGSKSKLFIS